MGNSLVWDETNMNVFLSPEINMLTGWAHAPLLHAMSIV